MAKDVKSNQDTKNELKAKKQERRNAAKKAADKKSRQNKIIFIAIIVVLALFAALVIFNKCSTNGSTERRTVVASTENFEVTQSMMTYFFNTVYHQYANIYSSDTDSFNSFIESVNSRGTSYDSIMSSAKQSVEQLLTYAEMAKAAGVELDKSDEAAIDSTIESYKDLKLNYAESNNAYSIMSFNRFLETMFGDSVNESVVRDCLELSTLASKYQEEFVEALEYTDEEYQSYFEEHEEDYLYVDLLKYTFNDETADDAEDVADDAADTAADTADEATEQAADDDAADAADEATEDTENTEDAAAEESTGAKALAEGLAATTTPDEFNAYMTDYLTAEAEKNTAEGEEVDTEKVQSDVEALASTKQLKSSISDEDAKDWAFADDTAVGSTKIVADEEAGTYTVYMITATSYRDEELTKNAAVLYLTDDNYDGDSETKANEIKAEWDAGEKSEEAFLALCEKYSESSHNHVEEGYTKSTADIGEWLYEEGRADGDVGVIHSDTNSCTYLVYFAGDGLESWKNSVRSAMQSEDFDAEVEKYQAANAVNDDTENPTVVTFDDAALKKVTPIALSAKS